MCDCSEIYSSQQINIPPTFPYLLRQYAKAAIRTQPTDLLRWSTAYFRCLSLNLPPPVKPRLEYPIPRAYFGLTPGWLKALMCQLCNNLTVTFQVLWDRWIGACLQHEHLINVLVLGGFKDPYAIPWLQFVGVCAGHLTESLTQTMILFCEIVTEEPEGGSAMVTLETFLDVYKLLANIDASCPQSMPNLHFTDSLLCLFREPSLVISKISSEATIDESVAEETVSEEEKVLEVEEGPTDEEDVVGAVASCPDIALDNFKTEDDFLTDVAPEETEDYKSPVIPPEVLALENADLEEEIRAKEEEEAEAAEPKESVETLVDYMPERQMEQYLEEIQVRAEEGEGEEEGKEEEGGEEGVQPEEEEDFDLKQLKKMLEMQPDQAVSEVGVASEYTESKKGEGGSEEEESKEEKKPIFVCIDAVPGIGGRVPGELQEAVIEYMKECSKFQHGVVMPRNIRHFNCPPLEVCPL